MFKTPILFIVFNRPDTTAKVFEAIRQIAPKKLYVSADSYRTDKPNEKEKCELVKKIATNIDWDCQLYTQFHDNNLGCGYGPRAAFKWFFENEEMGIILEDDCLPDLSFFPFCEEMLLKYKTNKKILNISGCNLGFNNPENDSYFFSRYMNMWGWATWHDRMENVDFDMNDWKNCRFKQTKTIHLLKHRILEWDISYYKKWFYNWNLTLEKQNPTWWDFQFIYHQLLNKKITIFPSTNLIRNLGFNDQATHTLITEHPLANLNTANLIFPLHHPQRIKPNITFEQNFIKKIWFWH